MKNSFLLINIYLPRFQVNFKVQQLRFIKGRKMFRKIKMIYRVFNIKQKKVNRVLICPDKFKFSLSSLEVSNIIAQCLPSTIHSKIISLADGGEGSLDVISQRASGKIIKTYAYDPLFRRIETNYFESDIGESFIEMAKVSGLMLLSPEQRNPLKTSTIGTGQLIVQSMKRGIRKINLLIGGSATNDGGIGCAEALGYCFYDKNHVRLKPTGENLINISSITHQDKQIKRMIQQSEFRVYTDVKNPLIGSNGASYVFGPQKGAKQKEIQILEKGMVNLNQLFIKSFGIDANLIPGSGAAGGLGAGCLVLFNSKLLRGIDLVFQVTNFQKHVQEADLIITGEGKLDTQTMEGKVVKGVIDRCLKYEKPVIVLCAIKEKDMMKSTDLLFKDNRVRVIELLSDNQKLSIQPQVTRFRLKTKMEQLIKQML